MASITINFEFSDGFEDSEDFEATGSVYDVIVYRAEEMADERSDDCDEDVACTEWEVISSDCNDYEGQHDWEYFGGKEDLNDWGEYSENVEEYGEAFVLRYDDYNDCIDSHGLVNYDGCWSCVEEFVQDIVENCYDIRIPSFVYVDWERTARDVMMDYSAYEGNEGYHIFSDH